MDAISHGQRENRVWSMSSVLSKEQFQVIQLTYVEEYTTREVGREVGISESMVRVLLAQAYQRIRKAKEAKAIVFDFDPEKN